MKYDKLALEQALWDKRFTEDVKSGRLFWITNKSVINFEKGNFKEFWHLYEKLPEDIKSLVSGTIMGDYFSQQVELHQSRLVTDEVYCTRVAALSNLATRADSLEAITKDYNSVDVVAKAVNQHILYHNIDGSRRLMDCPETMGWSLL